MRVFRPSYTSKGKTLRYAKWYVEFRDHLQQLRRVAGFTDKRATEELGRKLDSIVACCVSRAPLSKELAVWLETLPRGLRDKLVEIGLVDPKRAAAAKSLVDHLCDFRASLEAKGSTSAHVKQVVAKVARIVEACGFHLWPDVSAAKVQAALSGLRGNDGLSAETYNQYLRAIKQFGRWMVQEGKAQDSPVAHLKSLNVRTDRRHDRRALSNEELGSILDAARNGLEHHGLSGRERRLLYLLSIETGLRWSELHSLTRSSFDLESDPPRVTVPAAFSKRRREDVLPLRRATAAELREYLAPKPPGAPAFPMWAHKGAEMLRVDLEAAGVPYVDERGRYADFHALRHSFVTNLVKSGVHPKMAQSLARHSDINLTMSRYTHTNLGAQSEALTNLPEFPIEAPHELVPARAKKASAPGDEAASRTASESHVARHVAPESRFRGIERDSLGQPDGLEEEDSENDKALGNRDLTLFSRAFVDGAGEGIRTLDPQLGKLMLYH